MDMQAWQPILIALAVPVFALVTAVVTKDRDPALYRRLRHSTAALNEVPETSKARDALDLLVVAQAERLRARERSARRRKMNKANLALAVVLSVASAAIMWGLLTWVFAAWSSPWGWISLVATFVIGLVLVLFVWFGFAQIYDPPRETTK
ncbi:hypothetical protein [Microbacterium sp. UBA3486]|uniref:hypothetical protein n=1 Tax=Microbacterium TaxID=33882 RepID=UPI00260072E5|nr:MULTISPECIES: hypothetical protein [Microbacterium]